EWGAPRPRAACRGGVRGCLRSPLKAQLPGDLAKQSLPPDRPYPAGGQLPAPRLQLCPNEEATQLLGRHRRGPRPGERIEDEVPHLRRGQKGAADEPQWFLRGMITVKFLLLRDGRDAPDGGDLIGRIEAVYRWFVDVGEK